MFLEISQISQENTCVTVSYLACNFIKKETLEKVFSCKFCEISKSTFSYRTRPVAASDFSKLTPSQSQMFDKVLNKTLWLPARKSANFANYLAM